jgi:hypothetical protein
MSTCNLSRISEFFTKRLLILIAVVALHILIACVFIGGLEHGGASRGPNIIPIPVDPSGALIRI